MNTSYQTGLHILHDLAGDDLPCSVVKTSESADLIATFTSVRTGTHRSVYTRAIRGSNGALSQAYLVPDVTDNDQYDADVAPIKGTDDFFVVWTSNAESTNRRVYGRRFTVSSTGIVSPKAEAIQISQENGDYVIPRVVYNKSIDKFFVTWISVADNEVQSIYLDNTDSPVAVTYQGGFTGGISTAYYNATVDLHNSVTLNISLLNVADKIIAAYKDINGNVIIYQYTYAAGKTPVAEELTTYEVSKLVNFHLAFDDINSKIKIVFTVSGEKIVYGDSINYFSTGLLGKTLAQGAVILNQSDHTCARPFIKRTPEYVLDSNNNKDRNYVVAWETSEAAIFYNVFDSNYSQLNSETEVNSEDTKSKNVRVVVTDNQIALVFQATKYDSDSLTALGLLYYIADRTDI